MINILNNISIFLQYLCNYEKWSDFFFTKFYRAALNLPSFYSSMLCKFYSSQPGYLILFNGCIVLQYIAGHAVIYLFIHLLIDIWIIFKFFPFSPIRYIYAISLLLPFWDRIQNPGAIGKG